MSTLGSILSNVEVPRTAEISLGQWNVKDPAYGALGNDSNDDTAEIQAAINACSSAGGGAVVLPRGIYIVTGLTLPADVTLVGAGYHSVIKLKNAANAHIITITGDRAGCRNFRIDGNKANQTEDQFSYGVVSSTGIDDVTVEGLWIFDVLRNGIYLDGHRHRVHGCHIRNNGNTTNPGRTGIAIVNSTGDTTIGSWSRITDNLVEDSSEHGIKVYDHNDHVVVSGNVVTVTGQFGIYVQVAESVVVANNTVDQSAQPGIIIQGAAHANVVSGNTIKSSASHGILIQTSNNVAVTGNTVWDCTVNGIYVLDSPGTAISGNTAVNNGSASGGSAGITLNGSTNCSITGNVCRNNGSSNAAHYGAGILAWGGASDGTVVSGNRCFDNGTGKQERGIWTDAPNTAWVIVGNNFAGNSISGTLLNGTNTVASNG